jgi:hypothetical protein
MNIIDGCRLGHSLRIRKYSAQPQANSYAFSAPSEVLSLLNWLVILVFVSFFRYDVQHDGD